MTNAWGTYAIVTVLLCYPYCHAILVGWCSKNSNNVGTRTISAALYNSESASSTLVYYEGLSLIDFQNSVRPTRRHYRE